MKRVGKITALIQARCGSERLKGKVMMDISGMPMLYYTAMAANSSNLIDQVVVCTTYNNDDDVIESECNKWGVCCVRGSEDDVLDRFLQAHRLVGGEYIVRLTGDDPLLDPRVIDKVLSDFMNSTCDYASNIIERSWPRGLDTEVFTKELLHTSARLGILPDHREHVTIFARTNPQLFRLMNVMADSDERYPEWRLCVDTADDMRMIRTVFNGVPQQLGKPRELLRVVDYLKNNPHILDINSHVQQKPTLGKVF